MAERKTYNGGIYERAGPGQPWTLVGNAQQPRTGVLLTDPNKARENARADEDQAFQREGLDISRSGEERAEANSALDNPQKLRKEYSALPEVREYKIAAQMASQGLSTAANPQGDIALTYAFAKAMDPGSVVRDQEANMVTNSQPWFKSAVENIKKQFGMDGAGNFTPQARAAIRQEIVRALSSRKPLYEGRRAEMAQIAQENGISPTQVIGKSDIELYAPSFKQYAEENGDEGNIIASLLGVEPFKGSSLADDNQKPSGSGSTQGSISIPEEMQRAHAEYLTKHWGNIDPEDYAVFRINLDKQYSFGSNVDGYTKSVEGLNKYAAQGGSPGSLGIPAIETELSGFDQFRNNIISNPVGAGAASALNAAGFGLPSLLAPEQMGAVRDEYPISSFAGDVGGGIVGAGLASSALRNISGRMGAGVTAKALSNPLAGDITYGALYGATQADDPLYGAVGGAGAAFLGNKVGQAVGRAFPGLAGLGGQVRALDDSVPTPQQLRSQASDIYRQAESTGEQITGAETDALNDRISAILSQEGRLSPAGRVTEVQPKVKEAYQLVQDYAGQGMAPTQVQTVRSVIGDAVTSGENAERRIARMLMNEFDDWTDGVAPDLARGLAEGRSVASRYLQGDEIALARELADVRAGQFANSGQGNALRTDFRALDRKIAKGQETFSPPVEDAIAEVARGTPVGNILRNVGRFAPTGPVSAIPTLLAATGGYSAAGPTGMLGGAALAGLAFGARELGERVTNRSAQMAEKLAYGGTAYEEGLNELLDIASERGGRIGTATNTAIARALADYFDVIK